LGAFALSGRFGDPLVALSMNILTIAAAAAVILLPIVFFAIGPTLPRGDR
jgi:hypothetical protein